MSAKSTKKPLYVTGERDEQGRALAVGTLKCGIKLNGVSHKKFVMREALMGDIFSAEESHPSITGMQFNVAIWLQTLVSIDGFTGPFLLSMFDKLRQVDFAILRDAQLELDVAGEGE